MKTIICHISTIHASNDVRIFNRECCSLAKAGYQVHLVIPCQADEINDGVHLHPCPRLSNRLLHMLISPWIAMRLALKTKADIYHYHDPELIFMGFVLRWLFRKNVVFDVHESLPRQLLSKQWLPKWIRKPLAISYRICEWLFIRGQRLILASEFSVPDYPDSAYLVKNYPQLDYDLLDNIEKNKNPSDTDVPILIYVGSVAIERGADIYIELAGKLHANAIDFKMILVGQDSYNCTDPLQKRARQLGVQDKVSFVGRVDHVQAMTLISQASIGLCLLRPCPNYLKSLATKILEYMMARTAVLASNFDCWAKYVQGENSGMMADPENIDDVANACMEMLSDPDELKQMGQRGLTAVREKYNWDSEFKQLLHCYEDFSH